MALMDKMVRTIKKEKREEMMIDMMPLMMEGIDMNELMPKMMVNMLKDLSAEDIIKFLTRLFEDNDKLAGIGKQISQANLMSKMMMKTWPSAYGFDETVAFLRDNAPKYNWHIPDERSLTGLWLEQGIENPPRIHVLYFCNSPGGYNITKDDELKAMSVMMPMGVSIYETSTGKVEVAAMNISMMSAMFSGNTKTTLKESGENLEKCMLSITS